MSFDTVVGQSALTTTLKNAVRSGKLAHAYLFCGPRGVGKTTCARIFAKAINCSNPTADGEACNRCESCTAFNEQRSYSIFELDAASNNSVENIKTLMEQTRIPPQVGKYKVFIIDEVHMLSTAAFNAFLKTLEEPPAHVIFILATTEKHKILPTIISRCQIYDFERITVADIIAHLRNVATKEGITAEDEALSLIAEKADGGMRDALSLFDQAASFCQGNITTQKVAQDLNMLDTENCFRLTDMAFENRTAEMLVLANNIMARGFDGGRLINQLAAHMRNILMAKDDKTLPLLNASRNKTEQYRQQARKCTLPFLYNALKLMNNCDINYRQSNNKRLLVELTLIETSQLTQNDSDDNPAAGHGPKQLKSLFNKTIADAKHNKTAEQVAAASKPSYTTTTTRATDNKPSQPRQMKVAAIGSSFSRILAGSSYGNATTAATTDTDSQHETFTQDDLKAKWLDMCDSLPKEDRGLAARMRNLEPAIASFPSIDVTVDSQSLLDSMKIAEPQIITLLTSALHNTDIKLNIKLTDKDTAARYMSREDTLNNMRSKHPAVDLLCRLFDAELYRS